MPQADIEQMIEQGYETWDLNFTANGDMYICARCNMKVDLGSTLGTGTLSFAQSVAAVDPTAFNSITLPAVLNKGDYLKVTVSGISGFVAVQIRRTE